MNCKNVFKLQFSNIEFYILNSGQLKISNHISVLHVEQEVVGNDTTALDSVLECDEKRQGLINEEKKLTELMGSNGYVFFLK